MPYLSREGEQKIFYDDTGTGVPVITIHGFTENGSYWGRTGVSAALAEEGFRIVDMDMRGHGRSIPDSSSPDYSIDSIQSDIDALADSLGFDRFHLLTHATGGMAGIRYAMKNYRRLLSLISTDTASMTVPTDKYSSIEWDDRPIPPKKYDKVGFELAKMLREGGSFHQINLDLRANLDSHMFSPFCTGFSTNPDPERCWRWAEEIYSVNNLYYCADFAMGFGYGDPDPQVAGLRQIKCPSLLIVGELDWSLRKPMEVMARNIPATEYLVLKGLGHMIAIEDPERTTHVILSFLKKHG